ncbi:uncharacterized protein LOC133890529 [Phragmites australis]|uniref:uncharacterized protein LOC133890529 n=1 Tax=Phragmites australis TaxID=29695 RepID=UPI002D76B464|nr:uncharacterized protein LOC133890529 [Phragmites australis]
MVRIILLKIIDQYPLLIVIKHSLGPSAQVPTQPRRLSPVRPQSDYFGDEAGPSSAAPHPTPPPTTYYGTSAWPSSAAPSYHAGPSSQYTWTPAEPSQSSYPSQEDEAGPDTAYDIVRDFFGGTPDYDVLQRSQVSSAPLRTQPTHDDPRHRWSLLGLADTSAHLTPSPTPGVT